MEIDALQALEARYAMPTYARAPIEFVRGEGAYLWDAGGHRYLDFFSGLSVHNAGHCHPLIVAAIIDQAERIAGSSNLFYSQPALRLCERLVESSLGGRAFLCNSGAEANECAIKLVRKHAHERGVATPEIVVCDHAFHGRTLGTLAATPRLAREDLFGPLPPGFRVVARNDRAELAEAVGPSTAAVMIEPIQGESGVHPIDAEMLLAARQACDRNGALLVFDEIQTGMGRTGTLWAYESGPVRPDVLTTAKALGGGLPVGACVIAPNVGEGLGIGEHGSTFAGGAIGARAALAALEILSDETLLGSVRELGAALSGELAALDGVDEVRGKGLMLGVGLDPGIDARKVVARALEAGLVVNAPNPETIRLLPPLIIGEAEVKAAVDGLSQALAATAGV